MHLKSFLPRLQSPPNSEIIERWTAPDLGGGYELLLPQPPDPDRCEFLALGDTGDSEIYASGRSPQDALARFLAEDSAVPGSHGTASAVLHVGDVVYNAGEQRLYRRNFVEPFAPFLTSGGEAEPLTFGLPFLPVPGNHDYYRFTEWAAALARSPVVGTLVRALARGAFAYGLPQGGSDAGEPFMRTFVAQSSSPAPLRYVPGSDTRLPNRYYRFRLGPVDFFALDSNTLHCPTGKVDVDQLVWLRKALDASESEGPDRWRVLYLHHPIYTSIRNYAEKPETVALRERILALLRRRVHLVLSGHSHAFEWLQSEAAPHTAFVTTGAGGHRRLQRSIFGPGGEKAYATQARMLRKTGVRQCVYAGAGPRAVDGANRPLHHYLRLQADPNCIRITPVGVREHGRAYRLETPMPVFHADLHGTHRPRTPPTRTIRRLRCLEIRRGHSPRAHWEE